MPFLLPQQEHVWLHGIPGIHPAKSDQVGFFNADNKIEERLRVEKLIRDHLDKGHPCSLLNMENQMIQGYEEDHFITSSSCPTDWDPPPRTLTFGSWKEFGELYHCNFFTYRKTGGFDREKIIRHSLRYALELYLVPSKHTNEPYAGGIQAYDQWIGAIEDGYGKGSGNWWNAMVWGECRARAAAYMDEIGEDLGETVQELTTNLSEGYRMIAQNLEFVADKKLMDSRKIEFLKEIKEIEFNQIDKLKILKDYI